MALRGGLLLALGVGAYYGLEVADRALMESLASGPRSGPLKVIDLPDPRGAVPPGAAGPSDGPGNPLLRRAALAAEARGSIAVRFDQRGWLDGQVVETTGRYLQSGAGAARQFLFEQAGRIAGASGRLLRVSDSRFLWTDLAWGDPRQPQRTVARVDLRKVRQALARGDADDPPPVADDPALWARLGGLPMLLAGLDGSFAFGTPRLMELRGQRVAAMVGRWRPERVAELVGPTLPPRAPGHVVVALAESTLFPLLVEYRDQRDPLSSPGLPDDALLTSSRRPLLKIDLGDPVFGQPIDPATFTYRPADEAWADQTERELRLATRSGAAAIR